MVFATLSESLKRGNSSLFLLSASQMADVMAGALAAAVGLGNGSHRWQTVRQEICSRTEGGAAPALADHLQASHIWEGSGPLVDWSYCNLGLCYSSPGLPRRMRQARLKINWKQRCLSKEFPETISHSRERIISSLDSDSFSAEPSSWYSNKSELCGNILHSEFPFFRESINKLDNFWKLSFSSHFLSLLWSPLESRYEQPGFVLSDS